MPGRASRDSPHPEKAAPEKLRGDQSAEPLAGDCQSPLPTESPAVSANGAVQPGPHDPVPNRLTAAPQSSDPERARLRKELIKANQSDMGVMAVKNREERKEGGKDWYFGFRLVPRETEHRDPEEEFYWGAILPFRVARKHKSLLGLLSVHYRVVYCHEKLSRGTRIVTRPGMCKTVGNWVGTVIGWLAVALLAGAICVGIAYSQNRWPFG